jgi:hypothetical protein
MAANTVSEWSNKSCNGKAVYGCTILCDTANVVAWTKKTPKELNTAKPFTAIISFDTALDSGATPLALYVGYTDSAALSGTAATSVSDAAYAVQVLDDCGYTNPTVPKTIVFNPQQAVADVVTIAAVATGLKVKNPIAPYLFFNFTAYSGTLLGATITIKIIQ